MKKYRNGTLKEVRADGQIFTGRIQKAYESTIPSSLEQCHKTGRIDAFKLDWKEGMPNKPHIFWDSDVAKVIEGMAYMLALKPDKAMEEHYDKLVDLIVSAQQPDGYLNTYFTAIEPEKRWSNLADCHELYCAGHLMEAAVAGYTMLGKRKFLDAMCRYADYIDTVFGHEEGKLHGYPGHEEIELALVKLYEVTGNKKYLNLAKYFIDERGQEPNFFVQEKASNAFGLINRQAHKPVREQTDAVGHSVRAVYLYSGMADVAALTGDNELLDACVRLFDSIVKRRMYITGGVGSTHLGEAFTVDYDLTNSTQMYAESCAAIGLVYFASRMHNITGDGRYADIVERAIFNGVLAGISLNGDAFFYTNYLEVDDNMICYNAGAKVRQPWFGCSCCPTNFCRFIPQMTEYLWSVGDHEARLNIPVVNDADFGFAAFEVSGDYPYDGKISVKMKKDGEFKFGFRIPGWCREYRVELNGERIAGKPAAGYIELERQWRTGDTVAITLDMPVETVHANLKVTSNAGRVALQRGPLVYALESLDNHGNVADLIIRTGEPFALTRVEGLPGNVPAITGKAWREVGNPDNELYFTAPLKRKDVTFTAIPYALWQNRGESKMAVWIRAEKN